MCISFNDARTAPFLEIAPERCALRHWQDHRDPAAAETLLRSHARLVHALARRWRRPGIDIDDLISAGMSGLLIAAERFDLSRSTRFSTYARWWIQTLIAAEVAAAASVLSVPSRAYHDLLADRITDACERDLVAQAIRPAASIEDRTDQGFSLAETLASDAPSPEHLLLAEGRRDDLRHHLDAAIADLPEPARQIMRQRAQPEPVAYDAIAAALDLTPAQVRTLEHTAHMRLRRSLSERGVTPASLW